MPTDTSGEILLIDKPVGISSFDVIRILRKRLGLLKMGHAGTLDPLASGILLVATGSATKRLRELAGLPKIYRMEILLGRRTASGDMAGKILDEKEVGDVATEKIKEVFKSLEGEVELPVPVYSALKVRGVPMYKLARRGEQVEPKIRKMKIYFLKFLGQEKKDGKNILAAELHCASGVYARSVAEEVGRRLGVPATVYSLRRTAIGGYTVESAAVL